MTEHLDFESSPDATGSSSRSFEGPLDLLLHLIRTNEVNIYDIPIALITEQYLGYIELMQELNLDVAGEFLVMAATLIHIKSRMLLPRPDPRRRTAGEEEDPREALVRRLLEHQKYKAAAELLHDRETLRSAQFMRADASVAAAAGDEYEPELEVGPVQPAERVPRRAGARERAARAWCCPPSRSRSKIESISCSVGCRKQRRADSRTCSTTATDRGRSDRDVPRAARDDSPEADPGVSERRVRRHSHLQAGAPGGRAAPHR